MTTTVCNTETLHIVICMSGVIEIQVSMFLDRHDAWRSLDPTLDIWSNFAKRKHFTSSFFCILLKQNHGLPWVTMCSQGFPRVPQGFPKVSQGSPRFPKVTKISRLISFVLPVLTDHYIKSSDGGL